MPGRRRTQGADLGFPRSERGIDPRAGLAGLAGDQASAVLTSGPPGGGRRGALRGRSRRHGCVDRSGSRSVCCAAPARGRLDQDPPAVVVVGGFHVAHASESPKDDVDVGILPVAVGGHRGRSSSEPPRRGRTRASPARVFGGASGPKSDANGLAPPGVRPEDSDWRGRVHRPGEPAVPRAGAGPAPRRSIARWREYRRSRRCPSTSRRPAVLSGATARGARRGLGRGSPGPRTRGRRPSGGPGRAG